MSGDGVGFGSEMVVQGKGCGSGNGGAIEGGEALEEKVVLGIKEGKDERVKEKRD